MHAPNSNKGNYSLLLQMAYMPNGLINTMTKT